MNPRNSYKMNMLVVTRSVSILTVLLVLHTQHTARGEILVASDENPVQGSEVNLTCMVDLNPDKSFLKFLHNGTLAAYCGFGVCTSNITKIDTNIYILIIPSVPFNASGEWTCSYLNRSKPLVIRVTTSTELHVTSTTGMPILELTPTTTELNIETPISEEEASTTTTQLNTESKCWFPVTLGVILIHIFYFPLLCLLKLQRKNMKVLEPRHIFIMVLFAVLLSCGSLTLDGIRFIQQCLYWRGIVIGLAASVLLNLSVFASCYFWVEKREVSKQPSNIEEVKELNNENESMEMEELVN